MRQLDGETIDSWRDAAERWRFAGIATCLLCIVGMLIWFSPFDDLLDRSGTPLGGDFVMLYAAGQAIADGRGDNLYDDARNQQRTTAALSGIDPTESWPYRYPPTVAVCMAPFSVLSLPSAMALFAAVQLGLLGLAIAFLRRQSKILQSQPIWLWAIVGCPLVLETILGGQSSLLALTIVASFFHYFRNGRFATAGAILALSLYKPNVLMLVVLAALIAQPKLLRGFVPVAIAGFAVAIWGSGAGSVCTYIDLATGLASSAWNLETPFWKVHGLTPVAQAIMPLHGRLFCLVCGILLSVGLGIAWRMKRIADSTALSLLLLANALFNPYVPIYDLVLLLAAIMLLGEAQPAAIRADTMKREPNRHMLRLGPVAFQLVLVVVSWGPHLSQSISRATGFQVFPLLLLVTLVALLARILMEAQLPGPKVVSWTPPTSHEM